MKFQSLAYIVFFSLKHLFTTIIGSFLLGIPFDSRALHTVSSDNVGFDSRIPIWKFIFTFLICATFMTFLTACAYDLYFRHTAALASPNKNMIYYYTQSVELFHVKISKLYAYR
jgi:amino acid transporter